MNLRVLVTGGSGTLGRAIVNRLGLIGCKITVLDLVPYAGKTELEYMCEGDIADRRTVLKATQGVDAVIHCAGFRDVSLWPDEKRMQKVNVGGAHNLIYACVENKVRTLINTSTMEVLYDHDHIFDKDETCDYPPFYYLEHHRTKKDAEMAFLTAADHKVLKIVNLRCGLMFGPDSWQLRILLNRTRELKLKSVAILDARGTLGKFPHVYVDNAAHAHVLALQKAYESPYLVSGKTYNIFDFHENMAKVHIDIMEHLICVNPIGLQYFQTNAQFYRVFSWAMKLLTGKTTNSEVMNPHYIRQHLQRFEHKNDRAKKELGYEPITDWEKAYRITATWLFRHFSETPGYNVMYSRPRETAAEKYHMQEVKRQKTMAIYTKNEQQESCLPLGNIPKSWT